MRYCTRCLYPENHPLHLTFDQEGVCSGCRIHEEKDQLPWTQREQRLQHLLEQFRNRSQSNYDCIVPVNGARDSYFIVHTLKRVYKMNPLLVTYNKHYNTPLGIENISYLRTIFDCDILTLTLDPGLVKRITRETLQQRGSMYWHCLAGQTVFPVRIAVSYKVPLIIWGAHQGCDQVGMFSHLDEVEMTRKYRKEHDLMGLEAEDLAGGSHNLSERELAPLCYPDDKQLETVGVRGIYLSNYLRWDSKAQHESMIKLYGYKTSPQTRTFDTYNDVDCCHYSGIHDYIKFLKWGYGKVTDHASREIRLKRLTREAGIKHVQCYERKQPHDIQQFLKWVELSETELFECIDRHRDNRAWVKAENGKWGLRDSIINQSANQMVDQVRLDTVEKCDFIINSDEGCSHQSYQMLTTGFVDLKKRPMLEHGLRE